MFTIREPSLGQGNSWVACQKHFILIMEIMNKFSFSNPIEPPQEIWRDKIQKIRYREETILFDPNEIFWGPITLLSIYRIEKLPWSEQNWSKKEETNVICDSPGNPHQSIPGEHQASRTWCRSYIYILINHHHPRMFLVNMYQSLLFFKNTWVLLPLIDWRYGFHRDLVPMKWFIKL